MISLKKGESWISCLKIHGCSYLRHGHYKYYLAPGNLCAQLHNSLSWYISPSSKKHHEVWRKFPSYLVLFFSLENDTWINQVALESQVWRIVGIRGRSPSFVLKNHKTYFNNGWNCQRELAVCFTCNLCCITMRMMFSLFVVYQSVPFHAPINNKKPCSFKPLSFFSW